MRPRLADDRVGYFTTERFDFTSDVPRVPRDALRQPLAAGEEGSRRADCRSRSSRSSSGSTATSRRSTARRSATASSSGTRRSSASATRTRSASSSSPTTPTSTPRRSARVDALDARRRAPRSARSARTVVDPRTGEILDADIGIDATNVRIVRNLRVRVHAQGAGRRRGGAGARPPGDGLRVRRARRPARRCSACRCSKRAATSIPTAPRSTRFVAAFLKDMVMHEVGHTLGLRHNFRASTVYTRGAARRPGVHARQRHRRLGDGVQPVQHRAARRAAGRAYQMATLGPYDYWAIEYGYREIAPGDEAKTLARDRRAHRREPLLAFATDEDASFLALDPQSNQLDLGADPLAYAQKRFALVRELLGAHRDAAAAAPARATRCCVATSSRALAEAQPGGGLRRRSTSAASPRCATAPAAAATPLTPVPADKQREALELHRHAGVLRRQLPLLAVVPAPAVGVDLRHATTRCELGRSVPPVDVAVDQQVLVDAACRCWSS